MYKYDQLAYNKADPTPSDTLQLGERKRDQRERPEKREMIAHTVVLNLPNTGKIKTVKIRKIGGNINPHIVCHIPCIGAAARCFPESHDV